MSFILYADKNQLAVRDREPITSGSQNVYTVCFSFSKDWEGLTRTAVFRAEGEPVSVLLDAANACVIPWEVLATPGIRLKVGVYGVRECAVILPTIWADLGEILPGTSLGRDAQEPTPGLYEQLAGALADKGEAIEYDGLTLSLLSGGRKLSSVQIAGGSGGVPVPGPPGPPGPPGELRAKRRDFEANEYRLYEHANDKFE